VTEGERVVGYARVSTAEQGETGGGLDAQRAAIEAECARRGWALDRIESDILSGRTTRRPGLQRALASCRKGDVAGIVVAKLDRLSRSLIDFASLLENARKRGYNVVALDLGVDLSTPSGELVANVMASVAQWERRAIGERTREGLAAKRANGTLKGRPGRPRSMPESVRVRISGMHQHGASLTAIARTLNQEGVPTAQGGKCWYPATVRAAVRVT
jgi:DNA invertase Pin-like site-specific DNA recombinase